MLYDPKWQNETKADPLDLADLVAWLKLQPSDGTYDYTEPGECVLCQFLKAKGYSDARVGPGYWREHYRGVQLPLSDVFENIALGADKNTDWTFGAALKRARSAA